MAGCFVIDLSQVATWAATQIQYLDPPTQFVVGPEVPETEFPDTLGFITATPGPSGGMEDVERWGGFQVRIRTLYPYVNAALMQADVIDQALLFGPDPYGPLWGTQIQGVQRSGGQPIPLLEDGPHQRISVICTYLAREIVRVPGATR